jgi:alpha-L-fucosidase
MQWWHDARFGMFIHWGAYSAYARHEWAMENEAIPVGECEAFARRFRPKPGAPREFARRARTCGQKYMVMTTKHHEGFCLFDTKTTDYCAPRQGPGRDLVREYVDAAHAEGRRAGFLVRNGRERVARLRLSYRRASDKLRRGLAEARMTIRARGRRGWALT